MNHSLRNTIAAAAFVAATGANAMTATVVDQYPKGHVLVQLSGMIEIGDFPKIAKTLEAVNNSGKTIDAIYLNSLGGYIQESNFIGRVIRAFNVTTVVPNNADCQSACFELFAAGATRVVGTNARVGVHRIGIEGSENDETKSHTIDYARRVEKFGVPKQILASMMMTPPQDMYMLNASDLAAMGVQRTDGTHLVADLRPSYDATTETPPAAAPVETATPEPVVDPREQKKAEFETAYSQAYETSRQQNRGRPAVKRNCDRTGCEEIVAYYDAHSRYVQLHKKLNSDSRAICRLVQKGIFEDTYRCTNWMTGKVTEYRWSAEPLF